MAREINLVPDIKGEMIKTLKLRNFIFFVCIIVAAASAGVTVLFGLIAGAQQLARDGKKNTIDQLSQKINSYSDLNDTLTIKDQLGNVSTLTSNKNVLSRTFNALAAIVPVGADSIKISELTVELAGSETAIQPTFFLDAQANAGKEPFIDYNVLDSFKKGLAYMRYDYGRYVDKEGNTIPAYCMIEQGPDGSTFKESPNGYYAYWTIEGEGCNPSEKLQPSDYSTEDYGDQKVVRIWRTPQFKDWYKEHPSNDEAQISLDGTIKNVEHFESQCISYQGDDKDDSANPKWTDSNDCHLIKDLSNQFEEGINIIESSNGRDSSEELVLRFNARIFVVPEFFEFTNTHMLAIAPSGRRNVTDSYVQVQSMFGQRASDCDKDDAACNSSNNKSEGDN